MRIAIKRANIVVGTGDTVEDGVVVVENNRIVSVGKREAGPKPDASVDLEGRTLVPGLLDIHVHMIGGDKAKSLGDEATCFKMYDPVSKALLDGVAAAQTTLRAGFTTVREVGGRDYLDVALRNAQSAGQVEAPRILASGPGVFVTGGPGEYLERTAAVDGPASAIHRVRQLTGRGVDCIKLVTADGPPALGPHWTVLPTREEIFATFAEAMRLGRLKAAHAMQPEAIDNVVRAGVDTVEHGWWLSEENCRTLVEHGAHLVGTLSNIWSIKTNGPALDMPWAKLIGEEEPAILDNYRMAIAMGVKVALGTDVGGNESYPHTGDNARELEIYVKCGMTALEAIAAGTLEAAKAIGREASIGSIESGKLADLVVIDGDPLSDIRLLRTGVVAVMQDGVIRRDDFGFFDDLRRAWHKSSRRPAPGKIHAA
jgi:imidazolonepropionase-like amidohydrolase